MDLYDSLANGVNSFDDVAGATPQMSTGSGGGLIAQQGNPKFTSQIDLNVKLVLSRAYGNAFDLNSIVGFTVETLDPADLDGDLKTPIPVILFGNSDFTSGYKRSLGQVDTGNWVFKGAKIVDDNIEPLDFVSSNIFTNGNSSIVGFPSQAVKSKKATYGDMILTYENVVIKGTIGDTDTEIQIAEVVVKCPQVAYGTLLDSVGSDTFRVGGLRYTVQDITKIAQFDNAVDLIRQSMFGKLSTDSINPNSMKLPSNQQDNIIDVPLIVGVDKNQIILTNINYDLDQFTWSLFIPSVKKIKA